MKSPAETIHNLIADINPDTIAAFCYAKVPSMQFEAARAYTGDFIKIYRTIDDPDQAHLVSQSDRKQWELVHEEGTRLIGRFVDMIVPNGILIFSLRLKGAITSRSSRKLQSDLAKTILNGSQDTLYNLGLNNWATGTYTRGLFFFYDDSGNFRLSLVEATTKGFRRQTYFVEHDTTGTKNRTFRYRMTNASSPTKAARGQFEKWSNYKYFKDAFSVETLTEEFYSELFAWYERAFKDKKIKFPNSLDDDSDDQANKREHLIRLITRLMFVWFIKQKGLINDDLFDEHKLPEILKSTAKNKDGYYRAILQNLFFATLNCEIGERNFAADGNFHKKKEHFGIKTLYRYLDEFKITKPEAIALFAKTPFLNGGLFECLDRDRDYADGFSRNRDWVAHIANKHFFNSDDKELGLINLLKRYDFTIDENSPEDSDIALDPELLGKVFENLLASYNPETQKQARKSTGSFYTPREIVNYMVDESLKAHLLTQHEQEFTKTSEAERKAIKSAIQALFTAGTRPGDPELCAKLAQYLESSRILDPACGSGAFPMGVLLRMVELLRILKDRDDTEQDIYQLKLKLIENCIYGIDIQCIAVQIAKLRFFISLVVDQQPTSDASRNFGINPLPNLENKFVAADSLIGLDKEEPPSNGASANVVQEDLLSEKYDPEICALKEKLRAVRHDHFRARSHRQKKSLRKKDADLRKKLTDLLKKREGYSVEAAQKMAAWDPYDQNTSATWSDPSWMFDVNDGFDIVIGNPPYGAKLSPDTTALLKQVFPSQPKATINSAIYFIYRTDKFLTPTGCNAYIIPKSFCYSVGWRQCAEFLMPHLTQVIDMGKAFEKVKLEQVVYIKNRNRTTDSYECGLYENNKIGIQAIVKKEFYTENKVVLAGQTSTEIALIERIAKEYPKTLDSIMSFKRGLNWQSRVVNAPGNTPIHRGAELFKWYVDSAADYMNLATFDECEYEYQKRPKILNQLAIAHLKNPYPHFYLQSAIDPKGDKLVYETISCGFIQDGSVDIYFILGLNNSKFFAWLLYKYIYSNAIRSTRFDSIYVSRIPYAKTSKAQQAKIGSLAKEAIRQKEKDTGYDVSAIEAEIDQLVYKLYNLTPEEIAIVEGRTEETPSTTPSTPVPPPPPAKKPTPPPPPTRIPGPYGGIEV